MTIDEAIKFCYEKSKNIKMKAEPQVFVDIAEWLEELKAIKSDGFTDNLLNMGYAKGYTKAIDDFARELHIREFDNEYGSHIVLIPSDVEEIAEQLKAGGVE